MALLVWLLSALFDETDVGQRRSKGASRVIDKKVWKIKVFKNETI